MRLKVQKYINKRVITYELETVNFTSEENKMLDILGEPVITLKKVYGDNLGVDIQKKIRTGFKVKVKLDGTDNIVAADSAADKFLEDLAEELSSTMEKMKELYDDIDGVNENKPIKYIDIKY